MRGWWRWLGALSVVVGVVLSPLRAVAATIPTLIAYDAEGRPTATMGIEAGPSLRRMRGSPPDYGYDPARLGYDGAANPHRAGAVHAYGPALELTERREPSEGPIYDAPAATTAAESFAADAHPTFSPGPYAGESIPARSPAQAFTTGERTAINDIMADTGCHTCGTHNPGTISGNAIPDHQPVSAINFKNAPQRLYPHCLQCSLDQAAAVTRALAALKRSQ